MLDICRFVDNIQKIVYMSLSFFVYVVNALNTIILYFLNWHTFPELLQV